MLRDSNDQWVDDPAVLQEMTPITYPSLDSDVFNRLASSLNDDEIQKALFDMSPWKAPGPDGYPAGFYQQAWDIVGSSIISFIRQAWLQPDILKTVNHTNICLIPKTAHLEFVNQFRPIFLCFIPERSIHENIVVAQELVHNMNKMTGKKGYFAIKVDLAKAYDMIHGTLFTIHLKRWQGIKAGREGPIISHLMFGDDLLLFGQALDEQMQCVMSTLESFCSLSGQKVSQEKTSILFSKNVTQDQQNSLQRISGYRNTACLG
ncbi:hypothetical protein P8452_02716 [Trifolium repens]|nr:hypothetical protein P8452_02716 [Trifolium repens]